jgi:hypothetical protein
METVQGLGFLALLGLSAIGGVLLRAYLPEEHLTKENMDALRLVTGLLVTFAAVLLSLQLSSAGSAFNAADKDRSLYAAQLARLDQCLRNLGAGMEPTRLRLRQYTAAVIASTWPNETAPAVEGMPDVKGMAVRGENRALMAIMNEVGLAIDRFAPADAATANIAARCRANYGRVMDSRWSVIEDSNAAGDSLFVLVVTFWLMLLFFCLGLQIPRRLLGGLVLAIGVLSVASAMFVIVDLSLPYRGLFGITSAAMREALVDMSR